MSTLGHTKISEGGDDKSDANTFVVEMPEVEDTKGFRSETTQTPYHSRAAFAHNQAEPTQNPPEPVPSPPVQGEEGTPDKQDPDPIKLGHTKLSQGTLSQLVMPTAAYSPLYGEDTGAPSMWNPMNWFGGDDDRPKPTFRPFNSNPTGAPSPTPGESTPGALTNVPGPHPPAPGGTGITPKGDPPPVGPMDK